MMYPPALFIGCTTTQKEEKKEYLPTGMESNIFGKENKEIITFHKSGPWKSSCTHFSYFYLYIYYRKISLIKYADEKHIPVNINNFLFGYFLL